MAKAFRFHGPLDWETAVRPRLIVADFVLCRPEKGRGRATVDCPFVASIVATRSSLEIGRSASPVVGLYRSRIGFAIVDLVIAAAGLSVVADSVVPVAVGFAADLAAIADF